MSHTAIAWSGEVWNPVTGCSHVSAGCLNCYAETLSLRRGWTQKPWTAKNAADNVRLRSDRLEDPLHWRRPRMVFVNSMSDLFHELVPDEFIDQVFAVMGLTPWHTYQILTKRPERMLRYMLEQWQPEAGYTAGDDRHARVMRAAEDYVYGSMIEFFGGARWWTETGGSIARAQPWPLPNVWLGVSVEDQKNADERIPLLLETPAAVRFLSCEPLIGPINLLESIRVLHRKVGDFAPPFDRTGGIDWVIAGGESGPDYRLMDVDWARELRDQCHQYGVPFFMKQDSGTRPGKQGRIPDELWVQEFPRASEQVPA